MADFQPPEGLRGEIYDVIMAWVLGRIGRADVPDAVLDAVVRHLEHPASSLCDCPRLENPPVNPDTRARMGHHCDCQAVVAAAIVIGAYSKTEHGRQCIHGTEMDEFYARPVSSTGEEKTDGR